MKPLPTRRGSRSSYSMRRSGRRGNWSMQVALGAAGAVLRMRILRPALLAGAVAEGDVAAMPPLLRMAHRRLELRQLLPHLLRLRSRLRRRFPRRASALSWGIRMTNWRTLAEVSTGARVLEISDRVGDAGRVDLQPGDAGRGLRPRRHRRHHLHLRICLRISTIRGIDCRAVGR